MSLDAVALANLPIGTTNAQAFARNAGDIDSVVNGSSTITTRTGKQILALDEAMNLLGYEPAVAFTSGLSISRSTQSVMSGGLLYHARPTAIPFVTSTTFNSAQWTLREITTADLASTSAGKGAAAVGGGIVSVADITSLRALLNNSPAVTAYVRSSRADYVLDPASSATEALPWVVVATDGGRWVWRGHEVWADDFDAHGVMTVTSIAGVPDETTKLQAAVNALPTNGTLRLQSGRTYRITDTLTLTSRHLTCDGLATILLDLNSTGKDGLSLGAVEILGGTAQNDAPAPKLDGIRLTVVSPLRDGIRLKFGDFPVWRNVLVQRDPAIQPAWRDGIHIESDATQHWIENLQWDSVRVSDTGRDGFRFEVPATGVNTFINVGTYTNCEVRGCGHNQPGVPVRFVVNSTTDEKISQHNFIGGEYQTNHTVTNPNPDGFRADVVSGGTAVENIHIEGATAECVPVNGTGLAINTTGMTRVTILNFLPYGYNGSPTNVGGTGDYLALGYLGLDKYEAHGEWAVGLHGVATAGSPVVAFQKGVYSRVGKIITVSGQIQITSWGGAAGQIWITGLPYPIKNDAFAQPVFNFWRVSTLTSGAGYTQVCARGVYNTTTATVHKNGFGVAEAIVNVADASTTFDLGFSGTYYTN